MVSRCSSDKHSVRGLNPKSSMNHKIILQKTEIHLGRPVSLHSRTRGGLTERWRLVKASDVAPQSEPPPRAFDEAPSDGAI